MISKVMISSMSCAKVGLQNNPRILCGVRTTTGLVYHQESFGYTQLPDLYILILLRYKLGSNNKDIYLWYAMGILS